MRTNRREMTDQGAPEFTEASESSRESSMQEEATLSPRPDRTEEPLMRRRPNRIGPGKRSRLVYPPRPGYHRHVFNDVDDNIEIAKERGYEVVRQEGLRGGDQRAGDAEQVGSVVGKPVGGGKRGVLMEIPQEWYEEDQKVVQDEINEQMHAMTELPNAPGNYGRVNINS